MKPVDKLALARWRELDAVTVLGALAQHAKQDNSYAPVANNATSRWHATVDGYDFELLLTGAKFWDTRAGCGGGGGVDLAMHLRGIDFRHATAWLSESGL